MILLFALRKLKRRGWCSSTLKRRSNKVFCLLVSLKRRLQKALLINLLNKVDRGANQMINLEVLRFLVFGGGLLQLYRAQRRFLMSFRLNLQLKVWFELRQPLKLFHHHTSIRIPTAHQTRLQMRRLDPVSHKDILESHYQATQGSYFKSLVWTTLYKIFTCTSSPLQGFQD